MNNPEYTRPRQNPGAPWLNEIQHYELGISSTGYLTHISISADRTAERTYDHLLMVQTMKAFRIRRIHDLGISTGCACHPASWSYGSEYARRRRHRNRRRHRG